MQLEKALFIDNTILIVFIMRINTILNPRADLNQFEMNKRNKKLTLAIYTKFIPNLSFWCVQIHDLWSLNVVNCHSEIVVKTGCHEKSGRL